VFLNFNSKSIMQAMVIGKCINASVCDLPTSSGTSLVSISN